MIVSFPWYDLPEVQWANDHLFRATGLPGELNRTLTPSETWHRPDLLLSQACGLDLFLTDAPISPIAVPVFDLDCPPGYYYSYIVGDPTGDVAAVNSRTSRSGLSALFEICSPTNVHITGSHVASLSALRAGTAAVAAIDAVTWHILERSAPEHLDGIRIAVQSPAMTAPPFVCRRGSSTSDIIDSLSSAFADPSVAHTALGIRAIKPVTLSDYDPVLEEYLRIAQCLPANCAPPATATHT